MGHAETWPADTTSAPVHPPGALSTSWGVPRTAFRTCAVPVTPQGKAPLSGLLQYPRHLRLWTLTGHVLGTRLTPRKWYHHPDFSGS